MNRALFRLHRVLFLGYAIAGAVLSLSGLRFSEEVQMPFWVFALAISMPLAVLHLFAALGAQRGAAWGRTLSKVIASLMLLGVPIGTAIGIYIFSKTGERWQSSSGRL